MPFRSDQPNPLNTAPLDYIKYAVGVLAALLLVPALLQGALAFLQTFLQTLLSIVLTLNLLMLSAVAGVVGVWIWQRRVLGEVADPITIDPTLTEQPTRLEASALLRDTVEPQRPIAGLKAASGLPPQVEATPHQNHAGDSAALDGDPHAVVTVDPGPKVMPVTIPDVTPDSDRSGGNPPIPCLDSQVRPEPLIQAQLARRLGVSSSTIGVRKLKPDFGEWSSQKDPAGLAWRYCEEARQFVVVSV